jgi:glycerophosphoryl diester phosphodiesterase
MPVHGILPHCDPRRLGEMGPSRRYQAVDHLNADCQPSRSGLPLVVAHRGASAELPANTIAAFERAAALGADMIEFDVRLSADDQLIVYHDAEVGGRPVAGLTRSAIRDRSGVLPPLLAEVIELARGRTGLDVELKEAGYTRRAVEAIAGGVDPARTVLSSFLGEVVAELRQLVPGYGRGLIVREEQSRTQGGLDPARRAFELGATHLVLHRNLADPKLMRGARRLGLDVWVWTGNDEGSLKAQLGDPLVSGVVTDLPEMAIRLRAGYSRL